MAKKEVTVVINGEESVSAATESAGAGLTLFGKKIPFVLDATKLLEMGLSALKAAFGAAKDFVLNSIEAYDKFSASQRKLEGTAKLSGIALGTLKDIAETGRKAFGLAAGTSNEFASEIGKLTSKSGDISKSKDAMAAFLDIGAARGLSAAETLKAVQQAVLGIDEGTDKLFGKNPSVLYEEYADKIGKSAGKLTDQEKSQALLDATLTGGEATRGAYLEYLQSAAGQQEQMNQKVEESQVKFGEAIQPIRTLVLQGLNKLLDVLGPVVLWLGQAANTAGVTLVRGFNSMKETVGEVVQVFGRITGNKDMEAWGKATAESARKSMQEVEETVRKAAEGTKRKTDDTTSAIKESHRSLGEETKKSAETVAQESERMNKALDAKLGKPMAVTIGITQTAITDLSTAARNQLPPETAQKFAEHMKTLADKAEESRLRMIGMKDEAGKGRDTTRDVAENMGDVADAALSAADEFGVIDEKASKSLDSAKKIFDTFKDMAKNGFSFAGAVGVIGGVAAIVSTMMGGDADRRRLMRENNQRLAEVRDGLAEFTLEISGGDQQTLTDILTEGLADGPFTGSSQLPALLSWLKDKGFSETRLDSIAKDLGINIRDKNGNIFYDGLVALLTALMGTNQGPRKNFGNDLSAIEDSFAVNQTDVAGQVKQLGDLGGQYSDLFKGIVDTNDLSGTRTRLRQLFADFQAGKISLKDMGGMSRSQFQSFLTMLIGRVDQAIGAGPTAPPSGSTDVGTGAGSNIVVGGGASVATDTVQSVIKAMDTNLAGILTTHTAIHERIAVATEGSYTELRTLNGKMDTLIAVSAGTDRIDAALEAERRLLAVQQGTPVTF
jgi:hypothetical protein